MSLQDRDHPSTIKRRFVSAFCMLFASPPFVCAFGSSALLDGAALAAVIGFRGEGLLSAVSTCGEGRRSMVHDFLLLLGTK